MAIRTTDEQREKGSEALTQPNAAWNEVVWTFLLADLLDRSPLRAQHLQLLFGTELQPSEPWFEAKPFSPRKREGNSRIDLAAGAIQQRGSTDSGIEPAPNATWVGFVEAKVLSDCSTTVANDPLRNQITRVIENLLCFQTAGRHPERLHFSLLTPRYLREAANRRSRLYGYKFDEYKQDPTAILRDIALCKIPERAPEGTWMYPSSLEAHVGKLSLHWAAYEDVFDAEPGLHGLDLMEIARSGRLPDVVTERLREVLAE